MLTDRIRLFETGFRVIKENIDTLLQQTDANAVFLIDRDGNLITNSGDTEGIDLEAFATLSAADFSAAAQLAILVGEENFNTFYHQGKNKNLYFQSVTRGIIMGVIFDKRTTLGLVRVRVKNAAEELTKILDKIFTEEVQDKPLDESLKGISEDIESELDKIFG